MPVTSEQELIEAAVVLAGAQSAADALAHLASFVQKVAAADSVSAVVWDPRQRQGVVQAAAGEALALNGSASRAELDRLLADYPTRLALPVRLDEEVQLTFEVGWHAVLAEEELEPRTVQLGRVVELARIAFRSQRADALAHDRARYETLLDSIGEGLIIETKEGVCVNETARSLLALTEPVEFDLRSFEIRDLSGQPIGPDETPKALAARSGSSVRFRYLVRNLGGAELVLDGTYAPIRLEGGEVVGSVTVFRDVTDEHNHQRLTQELLQQLFDALPTAVGVTHPQTAEVLSVNHAFLDLIGYSSEETIGQLPPHPWWASNHLEALVPGEQALEGVARSQGFFRHKSGRLIPVELIRLLIHDGTGRAATTVEIINDLSERRELEQQVVASGKLAAIGELAAGVAHEINNPLFAILGLLEFLLKEAEPGTKGHDRLLLIQQTGLEIKEIVRALLDFAREPSDLFAAVSLKDVITQTLELVRRTSAAKEVEIVERYCDDPCVVEGSSNQLKQIFLNLLTNANQVMPKGGTITIELARDPDWVVATVRDTGPGIPSDILHRIFEPFYTTKRDSGGTGLGLSVSLGIAQAHGGDLRVHSRVGHGTSMILRLPAHGEAP